MDDLGFGLWLTALGMGTVFGVLVLLLVVLKLLGWSESRSGSRAARRTEPPPGVGAADAGSTPTTGVAPLTGDEIAAITIAVITHARVRRQQAAPAMRAHEPGSHLFANRWVSIGRGYQQQSWTRGK